MRTIFVQRSIVGKFSGEITEVKQWSKGLPVQISKPTVIPPVLSSESLFSGDPFITIHFKMYLESINKSDETSIAREAEIKKTIEEEVIEAQRREAEQAEKNRETIIEKKKKKLLAKLQ